MFRRKTKLPFIASQAYIPNGYIVLTMMIRLKVWECYLYRDGEDNFELGEGGGLRDCM